MTSAKWNGWRLLFALTLAMASPVSAIADEKYDLLKQHVEALKSQLEQVQETLEQYESNNVSKEEIVALKQDVAEAAEWKEPNTLIHIAGYADVGYANQKKLTAVLMLELSHQFFTTNIVTFLCWNPSWK